jgi:hypothetical protein
MIEELSLIPAALGFGVFILCALIYRIQRHSFWKFSTISSAFLFLSLLCGGICVLSGSSIWGIPFVGLGIAACLSQEAATRRLFEIAHIPSSMAAGMELRNDIEAMGEYSSLTEEFLSRIVPFVGNVARDVARKRFSRVQLFRGCMTADGRLDMKLVFERLQQMDVKETTGIIYTTFLQVHESLLESCRTIMSYEDAVERFDEALSEVAGRYGEKVYRYGLPAILTFRLFQPLISVLPEGAIDRINERILQISKTDPLAGNLRIEGDRITLDNLYVRLSQLNPERMIDGAIQAFSRFAEVCYAEGGETSRRRIEEFFLGLPEFLSRHRLLLRYNVVRLAPRGINLPISVRVLGPGRSFLVKDRERAIAAFRQLIELGLPSMCISSTHPDRLREELPGSSRMVWISREEVDYAVPPSHLDTIRDTVENFLRENEGAVLFIEGVEYLALVNDFGIVLRLLFDIRDAVAVRGARLIVSVNPEAFTRNQFIHLERCMEVI